MNNPLSYRSYDPDSFQDFVESLTDIAPAIERDIARLRESPRSREILAGLFRAMHNLKGDAALCKLALGVRLAEPIETLLSRLREGEILFSPLLGEAILLAVDRLEQAIEALAEHRTLDYLQLDELIEGLENLAFSDANLLLPRAIELIEAVTGFRPASAVDTEINMPEDVLPRHPVQEIEPEADLRFFERLARQLEQRSPHLEGRTNRVLLLAEATNKEAGMLVDSLQLEAAVYMHDVGMMFLAENVWLKVDRLSPADREMLRSHPDWAAGILRRIPRWEAAVQMVEQHHEMPSGRGYPHGLKDNEICAGAKILAIVDAFEAVNLKHSHRGHKLSALRAAAEVNACEDQFDPAFIAPFNRVIRRLMEQGGIIG